jgi:ATP-dependent Lon protease
MSRIPLFPLDQVLLPGGEIRLHIFEPRYRKMIARCMQEPRSFGVVHSKDDVLAEIGCEAVIAKRLHQYPDGRFDILAKGVDRIRITTVVESEDGYLEAETVGITEGPEEIEYDIEDKLEEMYKSYAPLVTGATADPPPRGPRWSFRLAERLRLQPVAKQELMEMMSENQRLARLREHLAVLIPAMQRREMSQELVRGNGRLKPPSQLGGIT